MNFQHHIFDLQFKFLPAITRIIDFPQESFLCSEFQNYDMFNSFS